MKDRKKMTANTKILDGNSHGLEDEKLNARSSGKFPKRFTVVLLCSLATFLQYTLRANFSVTIVAMVNETFLSGDGDVNIDINNDHTHGCPVDISVLNNSIHDHISSSNMKNGEFDWQPSTQGLVLGAFYYGYVITQLISGQLADFCGPKLLIGSALFTSSLLTLVTPLAAYYDAYAVVAVRVVTGLSQGFLSPAIYTIYSRWVPQHEKSTALAVYSVGGYIGTVVTMPLSAALCEHGFSGGWPSVFYVLGIFGLLCFACWMYFVYNSPEDHPTISSSELLYLKKYLDTTSKGIKNKEALSVPWLKILSSPQMWLVAITKFSHCWGLLLFLNKLPSYFESVLHFSIEKNGLINAIAYSTIATSFFIFGFLSDFCGKRKLLSKNTSRKLFEAIALFGVAACVLTITIFSCDSDVVVTCVLLSMVFFGGQAGGDSPIVVDIAPDYSGSLYGITNAIGSMPGFLAPIFVGILLDKEPGSVQMWNYIFYTSAAIFTFGCCCFFCVSTDPQPWGVISTKSPSKIETNANIEENIGKTNRSA